MRFLLCSIGIFVAMVSLTIAETDDQFNLALLAIGLCSVGALLSVAMENGDE